MRRVLCLVLAVILLVSAPLFAVGSKNAVYVGGTVAGLKENVEGKLDTSSETELIFRANKTPEVRIPYAAISELEYGQKAGRRVGVAIMISPLALFSKKRKHYFTVTYSGQNDKEQAAIFELGKDVVRTTLKVVETRSGKEIQFQDDDARKSGVGGR
jgi:hypothetical protein